MRPPLKRFYVGSIPTRDTIIMTYDELMLDDNIRQAQIKYDDGSGWSTYLKEYVTYDMLKDYIYITMDPTIPHCAVFGKESIMKDYFL